MNETTPIPWHQYALISYIAGKLQSNETFGKTAMQKLVYLMERNGVPAGYKFRLYNYGPYSADLAGDVQYVESMEGVEVDFDRATNVYRIAPGRRSGALIDKAPEFLSQHHEEINQVLERFGSRPARELELLATSVYLHREFARQIPFRRQELQEQVKAVKPKFSDTEVTAAIDELEREGYIQV